MPPSGATWHKPKKNHYCRSHVLPTSPDISSPLFSDDDAHVAAVMNQGGFCWLSEKRWGLNSAAVCGPVNWPEAAQ